MTEKQLQACLKYWQKVLRLQDWNIQLSVVDDFEDFGETRFDKYKNAHITLCSERTLPRGGPGVKDPEVTLVHELNHLHAAHITMNIEPDSPIDDALEEMIELISQSLVTLKRNRNLDEPFDSGESPSRPRRHAVQRPAVAKRGR